MLLAFGIFVYDFGGTFQARMGNVQQQTLTQSAQKDHAELLKGQIGATQTATKELSDSAARQRANKLITGSAQTAARAAKQADNGAKMVAEHAKTIANLHPTEQDTWGEWTTQKMFAGALLVHLVNFAMWTLAGVMFGAEKAHAATVETPAPVPPTPDRSTFAGRAAAAGVVGGAALGGAGMAHAEQPPVVKYWSVVSPTGVITTEKATTPKQVQPEGDGYTQTSAKDAPVTPKQVQTQKPKRERTDAEKRKYALLLEDVSKQVKSRKLKPAQDAIKEYAQCGQGLVERLQTDMQTAGLIERDGRGWKVVNHA